MATGPAALGMTLRFDDARGRLVLFARDDYGHPFQNWEREGAGSWVQRTTSRSPVGRLDSPCVYDSRRGRMLLVNFDNQGDRFDAYVPIVPAQYEPHGTGCPGTLGVPTLASSFPWSLPWLGGTLTATVGELPLSVGMLTMGFSDTAYGAQLLPYDLTSLGAPGCFVRTAPDASVLVLGTGNAAGFALAVPNQNALRGATFFQQAIALDPLANALGATMSNSVRGVVGTK